MLAEEKFVLFSQILEKGFAFWYENKANLPPDCIATVQTNLCCKTPQKTRENSRCDVVGSYTNLSIIQVRHDISV